MISTEPSLNILIITTEYPPEIVGGLGTHVYELADGLGRLGCEVTVLAPSLFARTLSAGPNVTVHFFDRVGNATGAQTSAKMQWFVDLNKKCVLHAAQLIKSRGLRPDIIHCHDWLGFPAAHQLGKLFKIPVIGTVHLLQNPVMEWWGENLQPDIAKQERDLCRGADGLITVSHSMRELIRETHGLADDRPHVIYNGMEPGLFTEPAMTPEERDRLRRVYASPGEKLIFFAGRLTAQKGIGALLESASQVLERWPTARYLIAGTPDVSPAVWDAERITEEAKKLFSGVFDKWDRIKFLGKVSRERLPELYRIADLAVVPSIYEPFGYAAIEAMAAGVPVVATAVGGLAEIVQDKQTGLLAPVRARSDGQHAVDIEKLTAAQLTLLSDDRLAQSMGQAGRRYVMDNFGRDRMALETLQVYRRYAYPAKANPEIQLRPSPALCGSPEQHPHL